MNIDFIVGGRPELLSIEPLLLIPFVENAFKHGISYQGGSDILIRLNAADHLLTFIVENHIATHQDNSVEQGSGIGLKNVKRRLELLYPGKHELQIHDNGDQYKINLEIRF
jgi:LytS/YehU family sensor histidine kinase